jgi:hypothetical protein
MYQTRYKDVIDVLYHSLSYTDPIENAVELMSKNKNIKHVIGMPFLINGYKHTNDFLKKAAEKMPDSLRGEKYIFASLSYSELIKVSSCKNSFCDLCPLPSKFDIKQNIPGIVIFSERAKSLSSWLNSIELYNIYCDFENRDIIIECGLDTKYLFSKFSDDTDFENLQFEPKIFEKNKKKSNGIHFIAVQEKFNQKEIFGFWTLKS